MDEPQIAALRLDDCDAAPLHASAFVERASARHPARFERAPTGLEQGGSARASDNMRQHSHSSRRRRPGSSIVELGIHSFEEWNINDGEVWNLDIYRIHGMTIPSPESLDEGVLQLSGAVAAVKGTAKPWFATGAGNTLRIQLICQFRAAHSRVDAFEASL